MTQVEILPELPGNLLTSIVPCETAKGLGYDPNFLPDQDCKTLEESNEWADKNGKLAKTYASQNFVPALYHSSKDF